VTATLFDIADRAKPFPGGVSAPSDFTLTAPQETDAAIVLSTPNWSLYCLDIANDQALFVELPSGLNLSDSQFAYTAQFEHGKRALVMPLERLIDMAAQLETTQQVAFLMSTGRCGSTLASRIFAQIPEVWSLSEPDVYTNLAFARAELEDDRLDALLVAATKFVCRTPEGTNYSSIVIKPRSESMLQLPAYVRAMPDAKFTFLYRDVVGYTNSLFRFAQRLMGVDAFHNDPDMLEKMWALGSVNSPKSLAKKYFPEKDGAFNQLDTMALGWHLRIEAFQSALRQGIEMVSVHYDDLNQNREPETTRLLEGCGISKEHLALALRGFDEDAHGRGFGGNDVTAQPLSADQKDYVCKLVEGWNGPSYATARL